MLTMAFGLPCAGYTRNLILQMQQQERSGQWGQKPLLPRLADWHTLHLQPT